MGDVQPERGLAGGGRRGAQESVAVMVEDSCSGGLLPGTQRPGGGPGGQGAAHRGARRSVDLVRHGRQQLRRRVGRCRRAHKPRTRVVVRSMIVSLQVTHFSDPGCPWAWSASPALAALKWRYGDQLDWRDVMIGLTESGSVYEERGYTPAGQARGYRNFRGRGMPFSTEPRERIHGTWPMCRVVVATRRLAPEREYAVFRALQFAQFTSTLFLEDYAGPAGGDRLGARHRPRRDHRRRPATRRPRRSSRPTRTRPARRPAARPSSRTSTPTPTAACATRRRA